MRKTCVIENEQRKKCDRGFVFAKLEESNKVRKCCADVVNIGGYEFYI